RTADWFGVHNIVCSTDSVDVYNPKVIQATMGSFFRVNVVYTNLIDFFSKNASLTVYGALLDGDNVYDKQLKSNGAVMLLGNESTGISESLIPFVTEKISIPRFGKAESLNVAAATAILCSESKRC
ncbi:MAG: RNA methyltransferase, partial [Opitutaceae bacterium]|nr:RNA methyltransferase [Opitutaceae bacterium]